MQRLLPLASLGFILRLLLTLLHVPTIVYNRHRHYILIREHEVNAFQFHHDLVIVTVVGMNIAIDVLLLLENCIVSGKRRCTPFYLPWS